MTSQNEAIHTDNTAHGDIALDWISQNVYWTNTNNQLVEVATYNGHVKSVLLTRSDGLTAPLALTLDIKNRLIWD